MPPDPNDLQRQINELRHQIDKIQATAKADAKTQEADMQVLRSNFDKSLAENKAAFESLRREIAEGREVITKTIMLCAGVGVAVLSLVIALVD